MSNRLLFFMTFVVLAGMFTLFALHLTSIFHTPEQKPVYIQPNNVKGSAIKHHKQLYTLNFDQQNRLVEFLNQSTLITDIKDLKRQNVNFEELVLYQFEKEQELTIQPIAYIDDQLLYLIPQWDLNGYLIETSQGRLKQLLSQTYDP